MYARVVTTVLAPEETDASSEVFGRVLPAVQELDGFKGMLILSELEGRRIVSLTLWESLEALKGATAAMDKVRDAESNYRGVDSQETVQFLVSGADLAS
jgi:heme-degrading monooxygenase HmoA